MFLSNGYFEKSSLPHFPRQTTPNPSKLLFSAANRQTTLFGKARFLLRTSQRINFAGVDAHFRNKVIGLLLGIMPPESSFILVWVSGAPSSGLWSPLDG